MRISVSHQSTSNSASKSTSAARPAVFRIGRIKRQTRGQGGQGSEAHNTKYRVPFYADRAI
jgi:hypothetical protein